jgi:hypothetical protein
MKKTHCQNILNTLKANSNGLTLAQVARSGKPWAWKFTSRLSDLRAAGWHIKFTRGKTPAQNRWELVTK